MFDLGISYSSHIVYQMKFYRLPITKTLKGLHLFVRVRP